MSDDKPKTGTSTAMTAPAAGQMARQDALGDQLSMQAETAGAVLAAQARAMVEARFVMALRRPRDWDDVRSRLLRACERPGFAGHATEKVWGAAWYRKPVGEGVEGFSIRFAEEAVRAMGNTDIQTVTVYDDETKRIVSVIVTDLEGNNSYPTSITLEKTVERRFLKKGEQALRVRVNSTGGATYVVWATDDEVFTKQQNLVSKAIRNGVLRLLPGDIQAECRNRILAIRLGDAATDPDKVRREIADGFGKLNILPSHLKEFLGHELTIATPAELADLRDLWTALKEGKTTWPDALAAQLTDRGEEGDKDKPPAKTGLDAVTEKLKGALPTAPAVVEPEVIPSTPIVGDGACPHEGALKYLKPGGKPVECPDCSAPVKLIKAGEKPVVAFPAGV